MLLFQHQKSSVWNRAGNQCTLTGVACLPPWTSCPRPYTRQASALPPSCASACGSFLIALILYQWVITLDNVSAGKTWQVYKFSIRRQWIIKPLREVRAKIGATASPPEERESWHWGVSCCQAPGMALRRTPRYSQPPPCSSSNLTSGFLTER